MPTVTTPYVTPGNKKRYSVPTNTSYGKKPTGVAPTVNGSSNLPWYMNPSANARPDTQYSWQGALDQTRSLSPAQQAAIQMGVKLGTQQPGATPQQNQYFANSGGGSRGGGGGGGGAAAETGLDQATLDWLFGQLGHGKPQDLTYNALDLPDPAQFYGKFDTTMYDQAGQGVTAGIDAMRSRGNQALDFALGELGRYQDPYAAGPQQQNPYLADAMGRMAAANGSMGQLNQSVGEGAQADQAMRNAYALMSGNDRSRNAANARAIEGDRRTMESNLGLEGNLLGLGVNMAKAKGQSAWDQMIRQAQLEAANTESSQNWQRQNTVGDTNVGNRNSWNQNMINTLLQIVGSKAPSAVLPAGWMSGYV